MLLKHIKESIKQKHANNGNKSLKNNYTINTTNKDRSRWANRKYQLEVRDSLKDRQINKDLLKTLTRLAKKHNIDIKKLGTLKTLEILKTL